MIFASGGYGTPRRTTLTQVHTPATHSSKYGNSKKSFFNLSNRDIPEDVANDLEEIGRHGLAKKTWSSYATAERMLLMFLKEKGLKKELPLSEETTLRFIHWMIITRKLKSGTISSYLAGIRQLHISKGMPCPSIRSETVNLILKGLQNKANIESRDKKMSRRPITMDLMGVLKKRLREWDTSATNQRMVWAVATNLFHGAFRIGELLCNKNSEFDPNFELTTESTERRQEGPIRNCGRLRYRRNFMSSPRIGEMEKYARTLANPPASLQMGRRETVYTKPIQANYEREAGRYNRKPGRCVLHPLLQDRDGKHAGHPRLQ